MCTGADGLSSLTSVEVILGDGDDVGPGLEVLLRAGPVVVVVVGVGSSGAPVARGPSGADGDGCCSGAMGSVLLGPSESSGGGMCAGLSRSTLTVS